MSQTTLDIIESKIERPFNRTDVRLTTHAGEHTAFESFHGNIKNSRVGDLAAQ